MRTDAGLRSASVLTFCVLNHMAPRLLLSWLKPPLLSWLKPPLPLMEKRVPITTLFVSSHSTHRTLPAPKVPKLTFQSEKLITSRCHLSHPPRRSVDHRMENFLDTAYKGLRELVPATSSGSQPAALLPHAAGRHPRRYTVVLASRWRTLPPNTPWTPPL